jgi:predicted transcriptional regulator
MFNEGKVMGHILHNLMAEEYEHSLDSIKRDINYDVKVDLEGITEDICEKFGDLSKCKGIDDDDDDVEDTEKALVITGAFNKNAFKGNCCVCGKKRHKGTDCGKQ